jgi:phosphatidylglycerol lysyltransferase
VSIDERAYRLSCLKKYGKNSLSYLSLYDDLLSFRGAWDGFIAYQKRFHIHVILGDPIVSEESLPQALRDLKESCSSQKVPLCFFCCTNNAVAALKHEGFEGVYIGREAVVDLKKFHVSGKKRASIRSSIHHAERSRLTVEEYRYAVERSSKIENEINTLSREWIYLHGMTELTFAFGHVDFEHYNEIRYFICKQEGNIVGFVSYYPIYGNKSYYLDLTRRGLSSPRGTIDYLIAESFKTLKDEGVEKIYIGFAPLSFIELDPQTNSRLVTNLFILFKPFFQFFYPAKSEFFFKDKFATDWEPNYVFYYPRMSIRMLLSLIHTIYEGGIGALLLNKIKSLMKSSTHKTRSTYFWKVLRQYVE